MSDLLLPDGLVPSNLLLPPELQGATVEGDLYHICERIKEIDESLSIAPTLDDEWPFAIVEHCRDGVDRVVYKAKELDNRLLERLRYVMSVPLQKRMEIIEKDNLKFEAEAREREFEELYERLGRPMWTQLEHDGFTETRGLSYPKKGVKPTKL